MKKIIPFFLFSLCVSASTFAALESLNKMTSGTTTWSNTSNWQNADVVLPPNTNESNIANEWDSTTIKVDGDYTVGKISSNSDTGYKNKGVFTYMMTGAKSDGTDGSITVDAANITNASIEMGFSGQKVSDVYNQNIIFQGGSVKLIDSSNADRSIDVFVNTYSSAITQDYKKEVTFNCDLSSLHDTRLGSNNPGVQYRSMNINLNGNSYFMAEGEGGTLLYKKVTVVGGDSSSQYTNFVLNIGNESTPTATFTSGAISQYAATNVNIYGTANVYGSYDIQTGTGARSQFNIMSGASLNISSGDGTTECKFVARKTDMVVAGKLNITHLATKSIADEISDSTLTIKNGGDVKITASSGDVGFSMTKNSVLTIEKGGLLTVKSQLRIYGDNARVVLKQENGLRSQEYNGKWKIIIGSNTIKDFYLDIYANQDFHAFANWSTNDAVNTNTIHMKIDAAVTSITFDKFFADNGALNEYRFINIEGFRNDLIFFTTKGTENDLLTQISASGFKDFYWEATTGGWYLNAIAVPEPATIASILGAFAIALAAYRKRK